ncbi:MAG: Uma2 family endonuclease [Sphingomonadaceae bacterium]
MTAFEPINVPHAAKLRVQDFVLLHEAGVFADYAKSELIDGEIWVMNALWAGHAKAQSRLIQAIANGVSEAGAALEVYANLSIDLIDKSMPEPDIVVAEDHDDGAMPLAKVKLVVEISDSTLDIDLGRKAGLYARSEVPEYWVVDIEGRRIIQHWSPRDGVYRDQREAAFGDDVRAATLAGVTVSSSGLA